MSTDIIPADENPEVEVLTQTELILREYPWLQSDSEPELWFTRFTNYYLPQGPSRNIYRAYEMMLLTEHPEVHEAKKAKGNIHSAANLWHTKSREWHWVERGRAYDRFMFIRANGEVEQARLTLLQNANKAALALVGALNDGRLKVSAAKEILDRAGLPGTTNVALGTIDKFSADELAQAEQEVREWEQLASQTTSSDENG